MFGGTVCAVLCRLHRERDTHTDEERDTQTHRLRQQTESGLASFRDGKRETQTQTHPYRKRDMDRQRDRDRAD